MVQKSHKSLKYYFQIKAAGIILACLITLAAPLIAADFTVQMLGGPNRFSPASLTIGIGDTVTWVNHDPDRPHSSTSATGEWDTDLLFEDESFSHTFTAAGVFQYYGAYAGMSGQITVTTAANSAPSVSITSPTNGATFAAPGSFLVTATADDTDGTITNVQFFAEANLIGNRTAAPFSVTVSNLPAGDHALTARAADNQGLIATSAPVNVSIVIPGELRLRSPDVSAQQFTISFTTTPNLTYVLEATSDLSLDWAAVSTNVASGSLTTVTNSAPMPPAQFYRARLVR
jgi:plastocyanin